jgi:D-serine dehydratase
MSIPSESREISAKDPLQAVPLDWTCKGLAAEMDGRTPKQLANLGISLFDDRVFFPAAVLRDSALRANSDWMRRFLDLTGASIAPHGKTTMAPVLFRQQLEDGAWAISAATMHHVRAYRRFGVARVFLANQLMGVGAADWVIAELRNDAAFDFYCLIDSVEGVDLLAAAARRGNATRPLQVLIEVGQNGGRAGVRSLEEGLRLGRHVSRYPRELALVGIETFEGVFQMSSDAEARARAMIEQVLALAQACDAAGIFSERIILSAGGSAFFDIAAQTLKSARLSLPVQVLIRSGCYLSHDDGIYKELVQKLLLRNPEAASLLPGLQSALQIWTHVQSRPEPGRVICALGKRDVGADAHLPKLVAWTPSGERHPRPAPPGCAVTGLNDQHAFLECPTDTPLRVGDFVGFGISHPCTTFDRWRMIFRVDDNFKICGAIRTYF